MNMPSTNVKDPIQVRDDFLHQVKQTLKFYKKELEPGEGSFWWTACKEWSGDQLKAALLEYIKRGKYAPKPADIIEIIREKGSRQQEREFEVPDTPSARKATELDKAWLYCVKWFCQDATGIVGKQMRSDFVRLDGETEERYLHLVNHHAQEQGCPDSIPDEFKLKEVWG